MRRSEINGLIRAAQECFAEHGWALPPKPRWDVTDFGLGDWRTCGLVLVNLAEEPEYCEKLMYAQAGMRTPKHKHLKKKEDIVCRMGRLGVHVWGPVRVDRQPCEDEEFVLEAGSRVTLDPGVWHEFAPLSDECIIGEVSTYNDDSTDNIFEDEQVGRFPGIEEDEPPLVRLVGGSGG